MVEEEEMEKKMEKKMEIRGMKRRRMMVSGQRKSMMSRIVGFNGIVYKVCLGLVVFIDLFMKILLCNL